MIAYASLDSIRMEAIQRTLEQVTESLSTFVTTSYEVSAALTDPGHLVGGELAVFSADGDDFFSYCHGTAITLGCVPKKLAAE